MPESEISNDTAEAEIAGDKNGSSSPPVERNNIEKFLDLLSRRLNLSSLKNNPYAVFILVALMAAVFAVSFYVFGKVILYTAGGATNSNQGSAQGVRDIFEKVVDDLVMSNAHDLLWMERANFAVQVTLIVASMLATILAAVTTTENASTLKAYSITLTAVTAAVTVFLNVFHVQENIDTLIAADKRIHMLQIGYLVDRSPLDDKVTKVNLGELDAPTRTQLLTLHKSYTNELAEILEMRWRVWANVGSQSTPKK